tara:strand:+ start:102 stop:290 length:189 start_codon:yes stop_codon:yes gene_type:complete
LGHIKKPVKKPKIPNELTNKTSLYDSFEKSNSPIPSGKVLIILIQIYSFKKKPNHKKILKKN